MTSERDVAEDVLGLSDAPVELAAVRAAKPGVAVAVVAKRLGVAPATLRTWDRRYGLGPSERSAGSHRRYTRDDVLRLLVMQRLTIEGVAPADAARAALAADLEVERANRDRAVVEQEEARRRAAHQGGAARPEPRVVHFAPRGDGSPAAAGPSDIVEAALALDERRLAQLLAIPDGDDILAWWSNLVVPALAKLAERTVLAKPGESFLPPLVAAGLQALRDRQVAHERDVGTPHPSQMRRIVLVFIPPGEPHPLAAHTLASALTARGVMARVVVGRTDPHRVQEIVAMVRPVAVALYALSSTPDLGIVESLHTNEPELPIFVGLADDATAASVPLAANVQRVRSFSGLFYEVQAFASRLG